jgi:hypothetical protein
MFYQPTLPTDLAPMSDEIENYSDFHKAAFGCRPASAQPADPIERAQEQARLEAWLEEGERIEKLAVEVARFRLSRNLEYIMRSTHFGGPSLKRAFEHHLAMVFEIPVSRVSEEMQQWDWICYKLELPYSDAEPLKAWYEGLAYGSAELFSRAA